MVSEEKMFENVDGRTDGRTTDAGVTGILIAHLRAFGSGELKMQILDLLHCEPDFLTGWGYLPSSCLSEEFVYRASIWGVWWRRSSKTEGEFRQWTPLFCLHQHQSLVPHLLSKARHLIALREEKMRVGAYHEANRKRKPQQKDYDKKKNNIKYMCKL